jgi:hypothetical protein
MEKGSVVASKKSIGKIPDGIYARIPLVELTIAEAYGQVEDPSFWVETRALILFNFPQIRVEDYWGLTVGDHRELYDFLAGQGLAPALEPIPPKPLSPLVTVADGVA